MHILRLSALAFPFLMLSLTTPALAANYQLGYCQVDQNAPSATCGDVRGKRASGVNPEAGFTVHTACTAAKANARANLLTGIPAVCGANISCGNPCQQIQK